MKTLLDYKKTLNILYVEDDSSTSTQMKNILEKFFNKVYVAQNGEVALDIFKKESQIDLIISDINMPKMDGLIFLEILRKINESIPVIFVTARDETEKILKAIELEITNYVLKPIDIKILLSIIDKTIEKKYKNYLKELDKSIKKISENIVWNKSLKILYKDNVEVKLTKKELLLIDLLLDCDNRIYSVSDIISQIWDDDFDNKDYIASIKNIISRLRNKIPELNIENIYGLGYKIKING